MFAFLAPFNPAMQTLRGSLSTKNLTTISTSEIFFTENAREIFYGKTTVGVLNPDSELR